MKGVKDKTKEMARQLGLSDSILTLIERRGKADLLIFAALAVGLLVFIYMLAYYLKPAMNTENMMWLAGMGGKTAVQPTRVISMALANADKAEVKNEAGEVTADQLLNT